MCDMMVGRPTIGSNILSRKERRKTKRKAKKSHLQAWNLHKAKEKKSLPQMHAPSELLGDPMHAEILKSRKFKKESKEKRKQSLTKLENKGTRKRSLTKFEEYLMLESKRGSLVSSEEDMGLERNLGKKLKLKDGLLSDVSDGLSDLLEGLDSVSKVHEERTENQIPCQSLQRRNSQVEEVEFNEDANGLSKDNELSLSDTEVEHEDGCNARAPPEVLAHLDNEYSGEDPTENLLKQNSCYTIDSSLKANATKTVSELPLFKYVAPHRRSKDASSNELTQQLQRRTRGLLNRLSEDNVESIADDFFGLFQTHGRLLLSEIVSTEILEAVSSGPRGNEQYAAVFGAFIAGIASSIGMDFAAKFLVLLADNMEEQRKREDSLALRNLLLLLSYLYIFKLISCGLIYDLLDLLSGDLTELDVSMILTVLQTCGMGLRADDPAAMKDFVVSVQHRCEDLKAAAAQSGATFCTGKRMQFMLETICEIKNNRRRIKQEGKSHARLRKWLQKLGVEEVQLRALKWKKLLDPDKKGQWWISGNFIEEESGVESKVTDFVWDETTEAEKMLQLAASQKMNTEIRRAIFCVVMSAEDYMDAFEKLLRFKLTGKQDREIIRVIVECCLQEKVFNKYYCLLIKKLCHHDKNHRFTVQYCLWDHFKQLDSMEARRLANLAHLLADSIATFSLSLSVLKVVEFADSKAMSPNSILFYCIALETLLTAYSDDTVKDCFSRIASAQEMESLRLKLSVFIHQHFMKRVQGKSSLLDYNDKTLLLKRISLAKKAMAGSMVI